MYSGLTRHEQWVILGLIAVIGAAMAIQQSQRRPATEKFRLEETQSAAASARSGLAADRALPLPAVTSGEPITSEPNALVDSLPATKQFAAAPPSAASLVLDLNTASAADFNRLPGVGDKKAADIVADRAQRGPFATVDDLARVKGFGPVTVERLRPMLRVSPSQSPAQISVGASETTDTAAQGENQPQHTNPYAQPFPTPFAEPPISASSGVLTLPAAASSPPSATAKVNLNTASVEELDSRLQDIGPVKAGEIVKYRMLNGPFRSVNDLLKVKGIGDKTLEKNRHLLTVE